MKDEPQNLICGFLKLEALLPVLVFGVPFGENKLPRARASLSSLLNLFKTENTCWKWTPSCKTPCLQVRKKSLPSFNCETWGNLDQLILWNGCGWTHHFDVLVILKKLWTGVIRSPWYGELEILNTCINFDLMILMRWNCWNADWTKFDHVRVNNWLRIHNSRLWCECVSE